MMERKANVLKDSQLLPSKVCPLIKQRALGGIVELKNWVTLLLLLLFTLFNLINVR